jgi:hypothetical protein
MQKQWVRIEEKKVIFINRSLIGGTVQKGSYNAQFE